jgi:hypothetical protein
MKKRMVAYCGLVCTDCDAYIATQKNDLEALGRLAEKANKDYGLSLAADDSRCDGCLATTGVQIGYCRQCEIRACGVAKKVPNCAHCDDYACEKLESFFKMATKAQPVLDAIRAKL